MTERTDDKHDEGKTDLPAIADRIKAVREKQDADVLGFPVFLYRHESIDIEAALRAVPPSLAPFDVELLKRLREIAKMRRNLKFAITEQERCVDLKGDLQLATGRAKQNMDDALFALIDAEDPTFDIDKLLSAPPSPQAAQCVCGDSSTLGVVHRTDGPCFHYTEPSAIEASDGGDPTKPRRD